MAELLYESQGLRIVKNTGNSFCVVTLHYTADPAKRSPEWKREAAAGLTPEKFQREYSIDYTAVMGSRVFPELTGLKEQIIVKAPFPDFGRHARYWGGLDYGTRNPSSFHVYTISDGILYSVWELYRPSKSGIETFVGDMRKFPYWNSIRYIAADPNIWAHNQEEENALTSRYELFCRAGVRNLVKGLQNEETWVQMMRKHWQNENAVTFRIFETCVNQLREFETAIYTNQSERQLLTSSYRETIADVDNHSLDDCKYFMLSRPQDRPVTAWQDPDMVSRWSIPTGSRSNKGGPIRPSDIPGYY